MVRWANDGVLQVNATKVLVNDGEMSLMMVKGSLTSISPSFPHLTIIEKLYRLPWTPWKSYNASTRLQPTAYINLNVYKIVMTIIGNKVILFCNFFEKIKLAFTTKCFNMMDFKIDKWHEKYWQCWHENRLLCSGRPMPPCRYPKRYTKNVRKF